MKVLTLNREVFVWQNLYSTDRFHGTMKYLPSATALVLVVVQVFSLISSVLYFVQSLKKGQIDKCLQAFFQCDTVACVTYVWIVIYTCRSKLIKLFKRLHEFYDSSNLIKWQNIGESF